MIFKVYWIGNGCLDIYMICNNIKWINSRILDEIGNVICVVGLK